MAPVVMRGGKNRWVVFDPDEKVMASSLKQYTTEAAANKALKVKTGVMPEKPKKISKREQREMDALAALEKKLLGP